MYSINQQHQLNGDNVDFQQSPNHGSKFKKGKLDTIVIHYTAGSSRQSSVTSLSNPRSKASAHIIIGRDMKITQLIPFDTIAWHAGNSSLGNRSGFNNFSIGIEIDNAGILSKNNDEFLSWFGKSYQIEDVVQGKHRNKKSLDYWHKYTEWQIQVCQEICQLLIEKYDIKHIVGHEEISPSYKIDPGPAFPLDKMRQILLENSRNLDGPDKKPADETVNIINKTLSVTSVKLNIRSLPESTSDPVALPLKQGQSVKVLDQKNSWVYIRTEIEGWVNKKFLK